ncbi:MAG TPA: sulfotransferase, partial [bacterium]|nr:sulfotransferase [bacterium]
MLPNLIIIGAKKCATTSLHYYLSLHPDIFMSAHKELNFFVKGAGWEKGVAWYEKQFPVPAKVRGESSPNYTQFPMFGGVPERMHQVIPGAKLIYVLRDPVEQIISAYLQDVKAGIESRTLEEIIKTDSEQTPYIYSARYYFQVEQFLKYYPLARFLIIASEDLKTNAAGVMRQIFGFLGVNPDFTSGEFYTLKNVEGELVKRKQSKLERFAASREG